MTSAEADWVRTVLEDAEQVRLGLVAARARARAEAPKVPATAVELAWRYRGGR